MRIDHCQKWLERLVVRLCPESFVLGNQILAWLRRKKHIGWKEVQLVNQAMRLRIEELEIIAEARVQIV